MLETLRKVHSLGKTWFVKKKKIQKATQGGGRLSVKGKPSVTLLHSLHICCMMSRDKLRRISFDMWAIISHYGIWLKGQIVWICPYCKLASATQLGYWHSLSSRPFSSQFSTIPGEYVLIWSRKWPWLKVLQLFRTWAGKGEGPEDTAREPKAEMVPMSLVSMET